MTNNATSAKLQNPLRLKIGALYRSQIGTNESFAIQFPSVLLDLNDSESDEQIKVSGLLMRIDGGILVNFISMEAIEKGVCAHCGKSLSRELKFHPSEWVFYDAKTLKASENELSLSISDCLSIKMKNFEIDLTECIRQDFILNKSESMRCITLCGEVFLDEEDKSPTLKNPFTELLDKLL